MAYGGAWKQMVTQGGQTNLALREKGGMGDKLRTALAGVTKAKLGLAKEGRGQEMKLDQIQTAAKYKEYPETILGGEPESKSMSEKTLDIWKGASAYKQKIENELLASGIKGTLDLSGWKTDGGFLGFGKKNINPRLVKSSKNIQTFGDLLVLVQEIKSNDYEESEKRTVLESIKEQLFPKMSSKQKLLFIQEAYLPMKVGEKEE